MTITFDQKREIIFRLADPLHWKNVFSAAFFDNETRKWKSKDAGDVSVKFNDDQTRFIVTHKKNGSALTIEKLADRTVVTDEAGKTFVIKGKVLEGTDTLAVSNVDTAKPAIGADNDNSESWLPLTELGLYVTISDMGAKSVLVDAAGKRVVLAGNSKKQEEPIVEGKYFHITNLTPDMAEKLGMPVHALMMASKLVVALDMDVEPDIRTFNAMDENSVFNMALDFVQDKWDPSWKGPWQWRPKLESKVGDVSALQKAWADMVDFEGHFVAAPTKFMVAKANGDGYEIGMTLDGRERVWTHGNVLKAAINGKSPKVETITSKTGPFSFLHLLRNGTSVRDHRGEEWVYAVFKAKESKGIAKQTRATMRQYFGLSGQYFAVITFDDGVCLMAANAKAVEALDATNRAVIENGAMLREGKATPEAVLSKFTPA